MQPKIRTSGFVCVLILGFTTGLNGFQEKIVVNGNVESAVRVGVRNLTGRDLTIIRLEPEGHWAKKGEVIAELDSGVFEFPIRQKEVALQFAAVNYERNQAKLEHFLASNELDLQQVSEKLQNLEEQLEYLFGDNGKTRMQLNQLELELKLANQECEMLESVVDAVKDNSLERLQKEFAVVESKLTVRQLEGQLSFLRDREIPHQRKQMEFEQSQLSIEERLLEIESKSSKANLEAEIQTTRLEMESMKIELEKALAEMDRCRIVAPIDGVVRYTDAGNDGQTIEEGAFVKSQMRIAEVFDPTRLQILVSVDEAHIGKLRVGQRAVARHDGDVDFGILGQVRRVNTFPQFPSSNGSSLRYSVVISVEPANDNDDENKLEIGQHMEVEIYLAD